ncbi:redoxin family protein [Candidatus Mycoplasma pogonae]
MAVRDYLANETVEQKLKVGDNFPDFELFNQDLTTTKLKDLGNKKKVVIFFPSIQTPICDMQLNQLANDLKNHDVALVGVSNDAPIAGGTWCSQKNHDNVTFLSLFNNNYELAKALGLFLPELPALTYRAVFVLDENNKVVYLEYAPTLKTELNLLKVLDFL